MKALRLLTLMAACCAMGTMTTAAWGAEPPAAKPTTPAPAAPADESAAPKTDEPSAAPAESPATNQPATTARPKASGRSGSPERFVPSEQVRADFDVSFPIDI
jgi:hypothetical protein